MLKGEIEMAIKNKDVIKHKDKYFEDTISLWCWLKRQNLLPADIVEADEDVGGLEDWILRNVLHLEYERLPLE
jgi:hypothetical protein